MKGMKDLMKQAQAMQEQMQQMQEELARMEVTGESGAGMVRVLMTGSHEVRRVHLDADLLKEDQEVVEDLIAAACNDAVRKVAAAQKDRMSGMASGMGLPLGNLPFG